MLEGRQRNSGIRSCWRCGHLHMRTFTTWNGFQDSSFNTLILLLNSIIFNGKRVSSSHSFWPTKIMTTLFILISYSTKSKGWYLLNESTHSFPPHDLFFSKHFPPVCYLKSLGNYIWPSHLFPLLTLDLLPPLFPSPPPKKKYYLNSRLRFQRQVLKIGDSRISLANKAFIFITTFSSSHPTNSSIPLCSWARQCLLNKLLLNILFSPIF